MPLFFWTNKDFNAVMAMLTQILAQQQKTDATLNQIMSREKKVMSALDDLKAQVQENTDLEQSAVAAIQGIATQLREALANDDSDALQALSQQLDASAAGLASAIAANTAAAGGGSGGGGDDPQINPLSRKR